eukprot:TRINITY_DN17252_c0_g1_i2.p1 TRINITY_DN17252_c0_g1~~TRINITY_DN17252_c0_g1_i2.p1  ORF type:complete len:1470 (+),score=310.57 TRINITY_DN17252_c0_g1_i2:353-4762(+)
MRRRTVRHRSTLITGEGFLADFVLRNTGKDVQANRKREINEVIRRETLYTRIMELLTLFHKKMNHPDFGANGKAHLIKLCWGIVDTFKLANCLRIEIHESSFVGRLKNTTIVEAEESCEARHQRTEVFWDHYGGRGVLQGAGAVDRHGSTWRGRSIRAGGCYSPSMMFSGDGELQGSEDELDAIELLDREAASVGRRHGGNNASVATAATAAPALPKIVRRKPFTHGELEEVSLDSGDALSRPWTSRTWTSGRLSAGLGALSPQPSQQQSQQHQSQRRAGKADGRSASGAHSARGARAGRSISSSRGQGQPTATTRASSYRGSESAGLMSPPAVAGAEPTLSQRAATAHPQQVRPYAEQGLRLPGQSSVAVAGGSAVAPSHRATTAPSGRMETQGKAFQTSPWPCGFGSFMPGTSLAWSLETSHDFPEFGSCNFLMECTVQDSALSDECTWMPPYGGVHLEPLETPQKRYLHACQKSGLTPLAVPFVTGHSQSLRVPSRAMEDKTLLPIVNMVEVVEKIQDIDLSNNPLLTDKSVFPLLNKFDGRLAVSMQRLKLNKCIGIGQRSWKAIEEMLGVGGAWPNIKELELASVRIPMRSFVGIARALGEHASLSHLRLGDTGLGHGSELATGQIFTELFKCKSLTLLDLGWSNFSTETFTRLGTLCAAGNKLATILVANCSSSLSSPADAPIQYFLEKIGGLQSLTRLDISMNRIDYRAALVFEDAFEHHKNLVEVDASENPLGTLGIRSFLRVLCADRSRLQTLRCSTFGYGTMANDGHICCHIFDATSPHGRYHLELSRPYHRSILRKFYKTCERFSLTTSHAFCDIASSASHFHHAKRNPAGVYQVPTHGRLSFTFKLGWGRFKVEDVWNFQGFLERYTEAVRLLPSFRKVLSLFTFWHSLGGDGEKHAVLDALASDFLLTYPQLRELARGKDITGVALCRLLHCLHGGDRGRYLSMLLAPNHVEYLRVCSRQRHFLDFNAENPNGHYHLELSNPGDCLVADQCIILDSWETEISRSMQRVDTSQSGTHSHLRNLEHAGRELPVKFLCDRIRPTTGEFVFDYASEKRPSADCAALDADFYESILLVLQEAKQLADSTKVSTLRKVSHLILLTSLQLREMLGIFPTDVLRADIFAIFYFRVRDIENEKLFRVRFDDAHEIERMRDRLGFVFAFPFIQPDHAEFRLNLACNDQRVAVWILVQLAEKEGRKCLHRAQLLDEHGADALKSGVPPTWLDLDKIPRAGNFSALYVCAPEDRKFPARKALCEKYGLWRTIGTEKKVNWWLGLNEAPDDVRDFMEWMSSHYRSAMDLFRALDTKMVGHLTFIEFVQGIDKLKCKKLGGSDSYLRAQRVYRYLDPSGDGTISVHEWMVLDLLWKEMMLSMQEFVCCLQRRIGHVVDDDEFMDSAWDYINSDKDDRITLEEWTIAAREVVLYFGPSEMVFAYIDKDDEGTIDRKEFASLLAVVDLEIIV